MIYFPRNVREFKNQNAMLILVGFLTGMLTDIVLVGNRVIEEWPLFVFRGGALLLAVFAAIVYILSSKGVQK